MEINNFLSAHGFNTLMYRVCNLPNWRKKFKKVSTYLVNMIFTSLYILRLIPPGTHQHTDFFIKKEEERKKEANSMLIDTIGFDEWGG